MFRNFNTASLPLNDYLKKNREEAEPGSKFCNGMCTKFMPADNFFEGKATCKPCYYLFEKVKKMVDNNQITYDKFREDPSQIKPDKVIIPLTRPCKTCNEEKTLEQYEGTRKDCTSCRKKKQKINHEEGFKKYLPAIEEVKGDIPALTNLCRSMPVDVLKLAISHYNIHWDRRKGQAKDYIMVLFIDHFQSLLNPKVCIGGCGFELEKEFSVCDACKRKPKNLREEKVVSFEANLDRFMEDLDDFTDETASKLTKMQCESVAKKLGIPFYVSQKKQIIVDKLKAYFEEKRKAAEALPKTNLSGKIELNDVIIHSRADGMINATQLCKAGGKEMKHWLALGSTKDFLRFLSKDLNVGVDKLMEINRGGDHSGSWVHPRIAIYIAQWMSPSFCVALTRWINDEWACVKNNRERLSEEFQKMNVYSNSRVEESVQMRLQERIGGEIEVPTLDGGRIDLLTSDEIIEIKEGSKWRAALGQVLTYALSFPEHKLRIHLYDAEPNDIIDRTCRAYSVLVTYEEKYPKVFQDKPCNMFKTGPVFYIIGDTNAKSVKFKPAFEGVDINRRLKEHRSSIPGCRLEFLIYCDNAKMVESLVLNCFEEKRYVKNREWLYDVDVQTVIRQTRTILNVTNIKYTEEENTLAYSDEIGEDMDHEAA